MLQYIRKINPMTPFGVTDFGRMLSVGAIRFEGRFCSSRKGEVGGFTALPDSAWWLEGPDY